MKTVTATTAILSGMVRSYVRGLAKHAIRPMNAAANGLSFDNLKLVPRAAGRAALARGVGGSSGLAGWGDSGFGPEGQESPPESGLVGWTAGPTVRVRSASAERLWLAGSGSGLLGSDCWAGQESPPESGLAGRIADPTVSAIEVVWLVGAGVGLSIEPGSSIRLWVCSASGLCVVSLGGSRSG